MHVVLFSVDIILILYIPGGLLSVSIDLSGLTDSLVVMITKALDGRSTGLSLLTQRSESLWVNLVVIQGNNYCTVPMFNIKYFVMHKVQIHNKAISYLVYGSKARGLSSRTDGRTIH